MNKKIKIGKLTVRAGFVLVLCVAGFSAGCSKSPNRNGAANQPEATLAELNSALDSWTMMKGGLPPSVSALTNFPALRNKRLPAAPPGKKLAIDSATRQVVFFDE